MIQMNAEWLVRRLSVKCGQGITIFERRVEIMRELCCPVMKQVYGWDHIYVMDTNTIQ